MAAQKRLDYGTLPAPDSKLDKKRKISREVSASLNDLDAFHFRIPLSLWEDTQEQRRRNPSQDVSKAKGWVSVSYFQLSKHQKSLLTAEDLDFPEDETLWVVEKLNILQLMRGGNATWTDAQKNLIRFTQKDTNSLTKDEMPEVEWSLLCSALGLRHQEFNAVIRYVLEEKLRKCLANLSRGLKTEGSVIETVQDDGTRHRRWANYTDDWELGSTCVPKPSDGTFEKCKLLITSYGSTWSLKQRLEAMALLVQKDSTPHINNSFSQEDLEEIAGLATDVATDLTSYATAAENLIEF